MVWWSWWIGCVMVVVDWGWYGDCSGLGWYGGRGGLGV